MKAAQILLAFPPNATDAQKEEVKKRADSIYNELTNGSDFKLMVTQFSNVCGHKCHLVVLGDFQKSRILSVVLNLCHDLRG